MGHSIVLFAAIRTVTPSRKGSVLEALMCRWAWSLRMLTSPSIRVVVGSNLVVWEDVYSDIRKKPKNAVMMGWYKCAATGNAAIAAAMRQCGNAAMNK